MLSYLSLLFAVCGLYVLWILVLDMYALSYPSSNHIDINLYELRSFKKLSSDVDISLLTAFLLLFIRKIFTLFSRRKEENQG